MTDKDKTRLKTKAEIFKALAHPSRLLIVEALGDGEKCVCELQKLVEADMSTVSKHLSVLKNAGVVSSDKRGLNIYYSLEACCALDFLACLDDMLSGKKPCRKK